MSNLGIREQIIAAVIAALISAGAFYYFAWAPQVKKIAEIEKKQVEEQAKLDENRKVLVVYVDAKNQAPQIEQQLIDMEVRMPSTPGIPQIVKQLTDMANYSGLKLTSLSVSPPSPNAGYNIMSVTMPMNGTYFDVIDFLYRAYYYPREFYISTVNLVPSDYPNLSVAVSGTMFSYVGSADASAPIETTD